MLYGTLPTTLGELTQLRDVYLDRNRFSGTIPTEVGYLSRLSARFSLWENHINGTIPTEIAALSTVGKKRRRSNLCALVRLDTSCCFCSHTHTFWRALFLDIFDLGGNSLSGDIPTKLGSMNNLRLLFLDRNNLVGEIPSQLGQLSGLGKFGCASFCTPRKSVGSIFVCVFCVCNCQNT